MNRKMTMLLSGLAVLLLLSCNHTACKRMCECADDESDECVEECEDAMDELSDDCQREMRRAARCMKFNDCDEEECQEEYEDMIDECI